MLVCSSTEELPVPATLYRHGQDFALAKVSMLLEVHSNPLQDDDLIAHFQEYQFGLPRLLCFLL